MSWLELFCHVRQASTKIEFGDSPGSVLVQDGRQGISVQLPMHVLRTIEGEADAAVDETIGKAVREALTHILEDRQTT